MSDIGAEKIRVAGYQIKTAAESISQSVESFKQSANMIENALFKTNSLLAELNYRLEELNKPKSAEEIEAIPPSIDFTLLPDGLEGQWVVIRKSDKKLLAHDFSLDHVFKKAGIKHGDQSVVVARVQK